MTEPETSLGFERKEEVEVVNVDDIISQLDDYGLPSEAIAAAVRVTPDRVKATLTVKQKHLSPAEEELADEVRRLAKVALQEANKIMMFGPFEQKMAVIKSLLSNTGRLIGEDSAGSTSEARIALTELFKQQREVENPQKAALSDALAVEASTLPVDDQDEAAGNETIQR